MLSSDSSVLENNDSPILPDVKSNISEGNIRKQKYNIEEIKERNEKYPIMKYYFEKNMEKFKKYFDGYFGFICRKYFHGLPQTSEVYIDIREESFIEIWEFLELGRYDATKGPFISYLYMIIRWKLGVHISRYNKKRKKETTLFDKPNIKFKWKTNNYDEIKSFVNDLINEYEINNVNADDVVGVLFFKEKPPTTFELKFILWEVYKKFL